MHRILVEERRWIGEARFLHALHFCMLLPGPEAQQLATYVGWILHRSAGGIAAGVLFVLPGALTVLALSIVYATLGDTGPVAALFDGLAAAVLAVVVEALLRIGRRALRGRAHVALAASAFAALFAFDVPFPALVAGAALAGFVLERAVPGALAPRAPEAGSTPEAVADAALRAGAAHLAPNLRRTARTAATFGLLWLAPVALLAGVLGRGHVFTEIAVFFSKAAVVTFGGAYAVLGYLAQQAVETYGWLGPGEMLDGLGLAETTPGPLILVTSFVGFLAAFRAPGALDPLIAGIAGAGLTLWVTFVPCFLWVFSGAPWIESLRGRPALEGALAAVTAAVVGVILDLALWFGLHVLFARAPERELGFGVRLALPDLATLDLGALGIAATAAFCLLRLHVGVVPVLAASALAGAALRAFG